MTLDLRRTGEDNRLLITDRLERKQISLDFPEAISPEPVNPSTFAYPVDDAIAVETQAVDINNGAMGTVLDEDGSIIAAANSESWSKEVPPGRYYIDVSSQVKTYLFVDAPERIQLDWSDDYSALSIDFGTTVTVKVGARSSHQRPPCKIVTSSSPKDVMTAISYFGAALKDDGPMRSFPNLRGHPPEIELGDELVIPEVLEKPDTGVRLELPPSYEYIFPATPLAYYLGARVEPAEEPRIVTDDGFAYRLDGPDGFERAVERTLKQLFTIDCFIRAGGPFAYGLARADSFEAATGLSPDELYDKPLAHQLETYLSVPYESVEPFVPEWGTGAHLEPIPSSVEFLPFLARDLAVIRRPAIRGTKQSQADRVDGRIPVPNGDFTRSASSPQAVASPSGSTVQQPMAGPDTPSIDSDVVGVDEEERSTPLLLWPSNTPPMVWPEPLSVQNQLWAAPGIPLGADKPLIQAYRNGIDRDPVRDSIEIVVVCNDDRMATEDEAVRELLSAATPFDIRIRPYRNLQCDELRLVLERGADFLHFIGHIDDDGFECPDGSLDASTLDEVNVDAFFLNACSSYRQGRSLVEAGSIAGVVTLEDVGNRNAVRTGRLMARLLNDGFPINTALRLASNEHAIDNRYTVVGDGGIQIAQAESIPHLLTVDLAASGSCQYRMESYTTHLKGLGGATSPTISGVDGWYLVGDAAAGTVTHEALTEALQYEDVPTRFNGRFTWSTDLADRLDRLASCARLIDESADVANTIATLNPDEESAEYDEARGQYDALKREFIDVVEGFESQDFVTAYRLLLD